MRLPAASLLVYSCGLLILLGRVSTLAKEPAGPAEFLVQRALQCEVDGDSAGRNAALQAVKTAFPEFPAAHWHSGQVREGDAWTSVAEVQTRTQKLGLIPTYRALRAQHQDSLAGQVELARWSRRAGLPARERFHWGVVLQHDRNHKEARGRLGVREYRGRLLTPQQIETQRTADEAYDAAKQEWTSRLERIRDDLTSKDNGVRSAAEKELARLDDAAVPFLESVFDLSDARQAAFAVSVASRCHTKVATRLLLRGALMSKHDSVRQQAITVLKERTFYEYVPALIGSFEAPTDFVYYVTAFRDLAGFGYRMTREGSAVEYIVDRGRLTYYPNRRPGRPAFALGGSTIQSARRQGLALAQMARQIELSNEQIAHWNKQVASTLRATTGQQLNNEPEEWAQWWQQLNELQKVETKKTIYNRQYLRRQNMSCFLAGTQVVTDDGTLSIEQIRPGDLVLAQNPKTGELAFQVVLHNTVRPPSPTIRLSLGQEDIAATLGHPIWVSGKGWRMAKEIKVGDRLHGVQGTATVEAISPGPEAEAYNLIVDKFHTYCIGSQKILVHDNGIREETGRIVPGLALRE